MTRDDFINTYAEHSKNHVDNCSERDFCANCFAEWLDQDSKRRLILEFFHLGPKDLANITNQIGGAKYYEFNHLIFLQGILLLYPYKGMGDAHEYYISYNQLREITMKLFRILHFNIPKIKPLYPNDRSITLDLALGFIIQAEQFLFHKEYLEYPPSGDDTYFDYYPGAIFYFNAINEWFLNSKNRIS